MTVRATLIGLGKIWLICMVGMAILFLLAYINHYAMISPPEPYSQTITCRDFRADRVSIEPLVGNALLIKWPDGKTKQIVNTNCQLSF